MWYNPHPQPIAEVLDEVDVDNLEDDDFNLFSGDDDDHGNDMNDMNDDEPRMMMRIEEEEEVNTNTMSNELRHHQQQQHHHHNSQYQQQQQQLQQKHHHQHHQQQPYRQQQDDVLSFGSGGGGGGGCFSMWNGNGNNGQGGCGGGGIFPSLVQFSPSIFTFGMNRNNNSNSNSSSRNAGLNLMQPIPQQQQPSSTSTPPNDDTEPDIIVARELNKLSMEERDKADNDLHCIADKNNDVIPESKEFVETKLEEMEVELHNTLRKSSYELALSIDPTYIRNRELRLIFLRADRYNCKLSAGRFIRFLDQKLELFGPTKLCKDITLDDLNSDDVIALCSGFVQFNHLTRDPKGRATIFAMPKFLPQVKSSPNAVSSYDCFHLCVSLYLRVCPSVCQSVCHVSTVHSRSRFLPLSFYCYLSQPISLIASCNDVCGHVNIKV